MNKLSDIRVLLSASLCLSIMLFATVVKAQSCTVGSSYQGRYTADYTAGPHAGESYVFGINLTYAQNGPYLTVKYLTSSGVSGTGSGVFDQSTCVARLSYQNSTPSCPGTYSGDYTFAPNTVTWNYTGNDCWGTLHGQGAAGLINLDE